MKRNWPVIVLAALFLVILIPEAKGASASLSMDEDEFNISVDPNDEDQGYLEIEGTVKGSDLGLVDALTVTLSVNITEEYDGEPTGRFWACDATFDDETVNAGTTRLNRNKMDADFTVLISPDLFDPESGDIIVPPGLSPLIEGKMDLRMTYSGAAEGDDIERATIIPEYYHLINLSTPTDPIEVRAGNKLNYTIRVKNAGNEDEDIRIDIPVLEDLDDDGWETSFTLTEYYGMEPGEELRPVLLLTAPNDIPRNSEIDLKITVSTERLDPDTLEPASSHELIIPLRLIESKIGDPVIVDDDDDDVVIDDDDIINQTPEESPYAVYGVISVLVVVAIIVIILLFVKRGGGNDGDEEDMSSAPVRM